MKKTITILAVVLVNYCIVFAQAPQKMSYQAVIRNNSNLLITSTTVGMKISVLQGSPTGTPIYVETQTPVTNANGLVTIEIGAGAVITGTFSTINWSAGPYYIKTETDPTGQTNYTVNGTSQLMSVPYALYAANGAPAGTPSTDNQTLSISGNTLSISNGNSVVLPTPTLSKSHGVFSPPSSDTTITYNHSLGVSPSRIEFNMVIYTTSTYLAPEMYGIWDASGQNVISKVESNSYGAFSTNGVCVRIINANAGDITGTITTVTSNTFTINWIGGLGGSTCYILWKAEK